MPSLQKLAQKALDTYNRSSRNSKVKAEFHAAIRAELQKIASILEIPVQISTPKTKTTLLGATALHSDKIYIEVVHLGGEIVVIYRACTDSSDFIGGPSQYMSLKSFLDTEYAVKTFRATLTSGV